MPNMDPAWQTGSGDAPEQTSEITEHPWQAEYDAVAVAARRLVDSIDPERIELHPAQRVVWDELAALVSDERPEDMPEGDD